MSPASPPPTCRIAKLFGRRAIPIRSTTTTDNTVAVHPSERNNIAMSIIFIVFEYCFVIVTFSCAVGLHVRPHLYLRVYE